MRRKGGGKGREGKGKGREGKGREGKGRGCVIGVNWCRVVCGAFTWSTSGNHTLQQELMSCCVSDIPTALYGVYMGLGFGFRVQDKP